ncbi:MAG: hypothetical protein DCF31_02675 [Alphaproteobacteria bacterium]|nr:MAG: hypothetical protein DCF31_02675 [Alphaproteobacteria bacterium]
MKALILALAWLAAAQPAPEPVAEPTPVEDETGRIVRGTAAAPDSAPWQIQIYSTIPISADKLAADRAMAPNDPAKRFYAEMQPWERDHVCGGVLIAPGWALTAAHCFVDKKEQLKPFGSRRVRLGNVYLPSATEMAVDRVIVHADYRRMGDKRHDIALIRLVPDARTDPAVAAFARPVRLWPATRGPHGVGAQMKVTGWGATGEREAGALRDVDGKAMRGSPLLLEAQQQLVDPARCRAVKTYRRTLWDGVMCIAGDATGQDACQGDSGGPLTRQQFLVGLVSTGTGCGLKGVPALYTRVDSYAAWIDTAMAQSTGAVVARCRLDPRAPRPALACSP